MDFREKITCSNVKAAVHIFAQVFPVKSRDCIDEKVLGTSCKSAILLEFIIKVWQYWLLLTNCMHLSTFCPVLGYWGTPICNLDFEIFLHRRVIVPKLRSDCPQNLTFLATTCRKVRIVLVLSKNLACWISPQRNVTLWSTNNKSCSLSSIQWYFSIHLFYHPNFDRQLFSKKNDEIQTCLSLSPRSGRGATKFPPTLFQGKRRVLDMSS